MRRCLLLMLLAILPLQFTWAAAAAYCPHESAPGHGAHFGHHEHQNHGASQDHPDDGGKESPLLADADCPYCHLGSAQPLPIDLPAMNVAVSAPQNAVSHPLRDSFIPPGLERPDWRIV